MAANRTEWIDVRLEIFRSANWWLGGLVWLCAAFVFPLHLGWLGASPAALLIYVGVATALLLSADAVHDPGFYRSWNELRAQSAPFLLAVAVPAAVAFSLGGALAPMEEALEDDVCRLGGFSETPESRLEELDDSFDITADCSLQAKG